MSKVPSGSKVRELPQIEPVEGWTVDTPNGVLRANGTPAGRLVRLTEVVRWLATTRELPLWEAVEAVCAVLVSEKGVRLYRLHPTRYARPMDEPLSGWEAFDRTPEEIAHPERARARSTADHLRAACLIERQELARLVNHPDYEPEYDEHGSETPLDFAERRGGPSAGVAVTFADAHAHWGWGKIAAPQPAAESPFPLADWAAMLAYRRANTANGRGPSFELGNQLAIAHAELLRRKGQGLTESAALDAMGRELGYQSAEPRKPLKRALYGERKRGGQSWTATPVRDGKKAARR